MPRSRSVRLAALGASAHRTTPASYGPRGSGVLRRRVVVLALVLASLAMITGYFREAEDGALHDVQGIAAGALQPLEVGAARVVRPFRDAWRWFDELRDARAENAALREELQRYRQLAVQAQAAGGLAADRRRALETSAAPALRDFRPLLTDVVADLVRYPQQIVVYAGRNKSVRRYDPVVSTGGFLVGHISKVLRNSAEVTLVSDRESAVSVYDFETNTTGLLRGRGPDNSTLTLDRVDKAKVVHRGDTIITAGRLSGDKYASFYPRRILVGKVASVGQSDTDEFKLVQVTPFANLSALDRVLILRRTKPLPALP